MGNVIQTVSPSKFINIKINFEDIQYAISHPEKYILIHTLADNEQNCLIKGTIYANQEVELLNKLLHKNHKSIEIIIYGKNTNDDKLGIKYNQLISLGFYNVYIYIGGLFEWLLLQDIYGENEFPTIGKELDLLKYRPNKKLNIPLLEGY
jgi:hypothetical protein